MKKAREKKEGVEKREEKERREMYAKETEKLERSVMLRSSFMAEMSAGRASRSSKTSRSRSVSGVSVDPGESLDHINRKLEKAKMKREEKIGMLNKTRTKIDERRELAMLKAEKLEKVFVNKSLHSYLKSVSGGQHQLEETRVLR